MLALLSRVWPLPLQAAGALADMHGTLSACLRRLQGYFDMTLQQAAVELGVGVTTLKKVRWRCSSSLQRASLGGTPPSHRYTAPALPTLPIAAVPPERAGPLAVPRALLAAQPARQDAGEGARGPGRGTAGQHESRLGSKRTGGASRQCQETGLPPGSLFGLTPKSHLKPPALNNLIRIPNLHPLTSARATLHVPPPRNGMPPMR